MEVLEYARILRRSWPLLIVLLLIGVTTAAAVTALQRPLYTATSVAFVSTNSASDVAELTQGTAYTQQAVKGYADIATTPYVLNPVITQLHLAESAAQLSDRVAAVAPSDTSVLTISATDRSPRRAAAIANAVTQRLTDAVVDLTASGGGTPIVKITQVQPATAPSTATSPRLSLNLALGVLVALAVAFVLAVMREKLDTRIRSVDDLGQTSDRPVIGQVRFDPSIRSQPVALHAASASLRSESFRTLRTNLRFLDFGTTTRTMVVTSAVTGEGKSTTAANLALTVADSGVRVALVDADLRHPSIAGYLGLNGALGLVDVLIGAAELDDVLQPVGEQGLVVLPAGMVPPNPNDLLQSQAMLDLLDELKSRFDTVIFDAPPLLPVSDAAILARWTAGAVVTCAVGATRRAQLRDALDVLGRVDARVLGLVATMVPRRRRDEHGQYAYESSGTTPRKSGAAATATREHPSPA